MRCPRRALPSNQTYISRCLGNVSKPYISLCLLNYDALHLTDFVGGVHRSGQLRTFFTIALCRQLLLTVTLCRQR